MTPNSDPVTSMRAFLAVAPGLVALAACVGELPDPERLGLVSVRAFSDSGTPVVRGSAAFYRVRGVQLLPLQPQECTPYAYSPSGTGNTGQTLNAGSAISFTIGAFSEDATRGALSDSPLYTFAVGSSLDFVSGDSALVSIPGAEGGFEAMAIKARLAEPFIADSLPTYVPDTPMNVTWQAATTPGSIMLVSLRFSAEPGAVEPDVEIACAFEDDGSGQIPAVFVNAYGTAAPETQEHAFIRVRDRIVEFDIRTRTRVRSIYEYPLTSLADAP